MFAILTVQFVLVLLRCTAASAYSDIKNKTISEYKTLCPGTKLCHSDVSNDITLRKTSEFYDEVCCESCCCDDECGHNCCPDQQDVDFAEREEKTPIKECISTSMKIGKYIDKFLMVSRCPPGHRDNKTVYGCRKHYSDFRYDDVIANLPPVSSRITQVLYKNLQCALCHGESADSLIIWKTKFACDKRPPFIPGTFKDMLRMVEFVSSCNIVFENPVPTMKHDWCRQIITKCNETGQWDEFDPATDSACRSYTSVYARQYKNVHCAICNGHQQDDIKPVCEYRHPSVESTSFVALLDFNQLTTKKRQDPLKEKCSRQQIFDPLKRECLPLHCNFGFSLIERKCVPLYKSITAMRSELIYESPFILVPQDTNTSVTIDMEYLKTTLMTNLRKAMDEFEINIKVCTIYSFVRLKTTIRKQIMDMYLQNREILTSDIEFIAVDILIKEERTRNFSRNVLAIETILEGLNLTDFNRLPLNKRSLDIKGMATRLDDIPVQRNRLELDMINNLPIRLETQRNLRYAFDIQDKGVMSFIGEYDQNAYCYPSSLIDFDTFCPKVMIDHKTYELHSKDKGMNLSKPDFSISPEDIFQTLDLGTIWVCNIDYLKAVETMSNTHYYSDSSNETSLIILTIVCLSLSITALCITLTVYSLFPNLRTLPGLNNMALVTSLLAFYIFSLVNACTEISTTWLCRLVGVSLHFSLLSSFGWMFICTFHMAKVFASISKRPTKSHVRTFLWYVLFVVTISTAIIVTTIVVSYFRSDRSSIGYSGAPCYVDKTTLLYNVAIPVGVTIVINIIMFLCVVIVVVRLPQVRNSSKHERKNLVIFAKLSTLTGLTWILAFLYQFTGSISFAYMFVILNASQGVFIMFSFIMNRRVYDMIRKKQYSPSIITQSTKVTSSSNGECFSVESSNKLRN